MQKHILNWLVSASQGDNGRVHNLHGVVRDLLLHLTEKQKTTMVVISCRTMCTTQGDTLWSMALQCLVSVLNRYELPKEALCSMTSQCLILF